MFMPEFVAVETPKRQPAAMEALPRIVYELAPPVPKSKLAAPVDVLEIVKFLFIVSPLFTCAVKAVPVELEIDRLL